MPNITNIPAPRVPLIDDRTGLMAREWYMFFINLFTLTGGGKSDLTVSDIAQSPNTVDSVEQNVIELMSRYDDLSSRLQDVELSLTPQANGADKFQDIYDRTQTSDYTTSINLSGSTRPLKIQSTGFTAGTEKPANILSYTTALPSQTGMGIYSYVNCSGYGFIQPMLNYDYAAVVGVAARGTTGTVNNSLLGGLFQVWQNSIVNSSQVTAIELDVSNEGANYAYPEAGIGALINTGSGYAPFAGVQVRKVSGAGYRHGYLACDINQWALAVGTSSQVIGGTPVFDVDSSGRLEWGPGTGAIDCSLYRITTGTLFLSNNLTVYQNVTASMFYGALTGNASTATYATSAGTATVANLCSGNSATATSLQTARTIQGQSFDGTANISIPSITTGPNTYRYTGANNSTSGGGTATLQTNLPTGSAGSTGQWVELIIDSTSFWVPVWAK